MASDNTAGIAPDTRQAGENDLGALSPQMLFRRHSTAVLSVCTKNAPSIQDAETLMEETFLRAFDKIERLRDHHQVRTWLVQIAHDVCADKRGQDRIAVT